jgi:hypothetical protein
MKLDFLFLYMKAKNRDFKENYRLTVFKNSVLRNIMGARERQL